ncbi:unnamed protein product [Blepharisma stoltei]|uniref:Uncharacterized protein n=1 Tax=Blepharisma stoltei TaxID=1481888 RepID=A0AAU9KAA9_9CILI|nr:unnamed protein product [Blepharisma stoltei]
MSKSKSNSRVSRGPPKLSEDFGIRLLEKELELEKDWSIEIINQLVLMYTEIIEYYEYYKDPRYLDFQDRMHKMLVKPQAITTMREESSSPSKRQDLSKSPSPTRERQLGLKKSPSPVRERTPEAETKKEINIVHKTHIQYAIKEEEDSGSEAENESESSKINPEEENQNIEISITIMPDTEPAKSTQRRHTFSTPQPKRFENSIEQRKKESERNKSYLSAQLNQALAEPSYKLSKNLERIIHLHQTNAKVIAQKCSSDFKSQDSDLNHRLKSRKKAMLDKSTRDTSIYDSPLNKSCIDVLPNENSPPEFSLLNPMSEVNLSFNPSCEDSKHIDNLEIQLEDLMEKSFSEKASKINEIKLNYEVQIKELEGQGGFMNLIVDQMKENMKKEIQDVSKEMDTQRKEKINLLKKSFMM